jgi:hypothetical protein
VREASDLSSPDSVEGISHISIVQVGTVPLSWIAVDELQSFIKDNDLQPMLRANYTRTAFQIPGDDRI